jgi:predicted flap endonuclease-1-like 5' DNA nuclease
MSTAAIVAGTTAVAGLGGAAISANAAGNAASTQANAADQAAQLQYNASQNALGFQEQEYNQSQANLQPWLSAGANGLTNLQYLMGIGGQPQGTQMSNPYGTAGSTTAAPISGQPTGSPQMPNRPNSQMQTAAGSAAPAGSVGSLMGGNPASYSPSSVNMTAPTASVPMGAGAAGSASNVGGFTPGNFGARPTAYSSGGQTLGSMMGASNGLPAAPAGTVPTGTVNPSLGGYGSLMQSYPGGPFVAPTATQALQSPGEQAQLQLGEQALQQSAAAGGNLLTGGTAEALDQFGQNVASTNYQNTYNNAFNTYSTGYNQWQQQQANEYNRLASIAGIGQTTAQQLGTLGQNASNNVSSNLLSTGQSIAQQTNNAAAANASGIVGAANAYGTGLSSVASGTTNGLLLNQLMNNSQGQQDANTAASLGTAVNP